MAENKAASRSPIRRHSSKKDSTKRSKTRSRSDVKSIFISYRRRDSSQTARWLAETLAQNFGRSSVFIDTSEIETGEVWPRRLEQALRRSSVMIAIIGPKWLTELDVDGNRRIDNPSDWVRKEIHTALRNKLTIIPLRLSNAELPRPKGLPLPLRPLVFRQAFELRDEQRETDVEPLLNRLEELGFERKAAKVRYPPPGLKAPPLTDQDLKKVLKRLDGWELDDSRLGPNRKRKLELTRTYEFPSFEDAIHFMTTAARDISRLDHHPDWENVWKTITVWLTTWDIGHRPSAYDVELAEYLDRLYEHYAPTE